MISEKDFVLNRSLMQQTLRYHPDVDGESFIMDIDLLIKATIKATQDFAIQIEQFQRWAEKGMNVLWYNVLKKNQGGAVGECLGSAYGQMLGGRLKKNPHESGSPDFLPVLECTKNFLEKPTSKSYLDGGFDSKSCLIVNRRFTAMKATSHHKKTRTALVVAWDYMDYEATNEKGESYTISGVPHILAGSFVNSFKDHDWDLTSLPEDNSESKPTSSARLLSSGVDKVRRNWIFVHPLLKPPKNVEDIAKYGLQELVERRKQMGLN